MAKQSLWVNCRRRQNSHCLKHMLPHHARCVLSRLRCNGHRLLLGSYPSRIGRIGILPAATADTCPMTPLISFCTVQLQTLCTAHSLATLCLCTTSGQTLGSCPASGAPWSSAMPPSLGRGRVTNNNNKNMCIENMVMCFEKAYKVTPWCSKLTRCTK